MSMDKERGSITDAQWERMPSAVRMYIQRLESEFDAACEMIGTFGDHEDADKRAPVIAGAVGPNYSKVGFQWYTTVRFHLDHHRYLDVRLTADNLLQVHCHGGGLRVLPYAANAVHLNVEDS